MVLVTHIPRRSQTSYTGLCNGVVCHVAQIGVFGFLPTTHAKTHAKQMHPRSSHAVQHFTHVYLHTWTAADAGDIHTWRTTFILITRKTRRPLIWAHVGIKMAQVLGSLVYIYGSGTSLLCTGGYTRDCRLRRARAVALHINSSTKIWEELFLVRLTCKQSYVLNLECSSNALLKNS